MMTSIISSALMQPLSPRLQQYDDAFICVPPQFIQSAGHIALQMNFLVRVCLEGMLDESFALFVCISFLILRIAMHPIIYILRSCSRMGSLAHAFAIAPASHVYG